MPDMQAPPLDDIALFVEVVRAGNFSKASARLGIPNATLSRRIAAMEDSLGVRLFERSTRRVSPTEAAQRYFERCAPLVDEARVAHEALRQRADQPLGHVRASLPVDLGISYLGDSLAEFMRRHPGITLDLDLSPRFVDLRAEPFDVALRLGSVRGDGLVSKRVGIIAQGIYAAPAYLDRFGRPHDPAALSEHRCLHIVSAQRGARWRFGGPKGEQSVVVRGALGLNSMSMMRKLAEHGAGIALLPVHIAQAGVVSGLLEQILPKLPLPGWPVYAVMASRMQPAAVRAFVDYVSARLAAL